MKSPPNAATLQEARRLVQAGISLVPISPGGKKLPAAKLLPLDAADPKGEKHVWKPFQARLPTEEELLAWFGNGRRLGIGVISGEVSGNLEQLDFDDAARLEAFETLVEAEAPGLIGRLVKIHTPRPGGRLCYRIKETVEGNQALARRQIGVRPDGKPDIKATIETRGEGGYALAPGSALECHETRRPYLYVQGDLACLPTITAEERALLVRCARALNEYVEPERWVRSQEPRPRSATDPLLPGADFNERGDPLALLRAHGWAEAGRMGETILLRRPGKTEGHSATLNHVGPGGFYVFSTSADPFAIDHRYDPFAVYTLLEHNGDFSAAGKALYAQGYGERATPESAPAPGDEDAPPEPAKTAPVGDAARETAPPAPNPRRSSFLDSELDELDLPEPDYVVAEILPPGAAIFAGKSKTGKTWAGLSVSVAVAGDGLALGKFKVRAGRVLYLGLEDNERRMKKRLRKLRAGARPSGRLQIELQWRRMDEGGFADLRQWLKEHSDTTLVVIDTWARFKPRRKGNGGDLYAEDYDPAQALNALAEEYGIAIVIMHHTRKEAAEDPFDTILATMGLSGGVGTCLVWQRGRGERHAIMHTMGRDVEEQKLALVIEEQSSAWVVVGDADDFLLGAERMAIVAVVKNGPGGLTPSEIALELGKSDPKGLSAVKTLVWKMGKDQQLENNNGRYTLPEKKSESGNPGNPRLNAGNPRLDFGNPGGNPVVTEPLEPGNREPEPDRRIAPDPPPPRLPGVTGSVTENQASVTGVQPSVTRVTANGTLAPAPPSLSSSSSSSCGGESKENGTLAISLGKCDRCMSLGRPADKPEADLKPAAPPWGGRQYAMLCGICRVECDEEREGCR